MLVGFLSMDFFLSYQVAQVQKLISGVQRGPLFWWNHYVLQYQRQHKLPQQDAAQGDKMYSIWQAEEFLKGTW